MLDCLLFNFKRSFVGPAKVQDSLPVSSYHPPPLHLKNKISLHCMDAKVTNLVEGERGFYEHLYLSNGYCCTDTYTHLHTHSFQQQRNYISFRASPYVRIFNLPSFCMLCEYIFIKWLLLHRHTHLHTHLCQQKRNFQYSGFVRRYARYCVSPSFVTVCCTENHLTFPFSNWLESQLIYDSGPFVRTVNVVFISILPFLILILIKKFICFSCATYGTIVFFSSRFQPVTCIIFDQGTICTPIFNTSLYSTILIEINRIRRIEDVK